MYGGKERVKKQYSPANTEVWITDLDMEWDTAVKSVWCGNELCERSMWHDKMGE